MTTIKVVSLAPTAVQTCFKFTYSDQRKAAESESDNDDADADLDGAAAQHDGEHADLTRYFTTQDYQASTCDALRRHYGSQALEQALLLYEERKRSLEIALDAEYEPPTIFEKMVAEPPSVHRTRLIHNYMQALDQRTVVLHRKRFFDDQGEKLIIMSVQLKYQ